MLQHDHDSYPVRYAAGRGTNFGKAKNVNSTWGKLCTLLSTPFRTPETRAAFNKLSKDDQDVLKAVNGWIMGAPITDGQRTTETIKSRDLLTLDFDEVPAALLDQIDEGLTPFTGYEFFVHSTRRHTTKKPRIRLFAPLSRPVTKEEYRPLSRILASIFEGRTPMLMVDKVSFRPAQMMFKPTASIDGDWFSFRNFGALIDPDAVFAAFPGWDDFEAWPRCEGETTLREPGRKVQDPTTKKGPVGDFCRAYTVPMAIETFLPDVYVEVQGYSSKPRYSFVGGTTTAGAVVEDDGKFLYSHHGSDPACDQLLNAYDLVRVHLYGELDTEKDREKKPTEWPSDKAMAAFIADDEHYRESVMESRYGGIDHFDDVEEEAKPNGHANGHDFDADIEELIGKRFSDQGPGDPDVHPKAPDFEDWSPGLELDQNNKIMSTMGNAALIIQNDARLFGVIAWNDFTKQIVALRSIKPRLPGIPSFRCTDASNGDLWQDINDVTLRAILEAPDARRRNGRGYGMRITARNLSDAVLAAAKNSSFHPIREYLTGLVWDGTPRIDRFLIDYVKCPDTAYHREIARLTLAASCARIFEPGCKFDYAIILQGKTGIRKSSAVKALYSSRWFGELHCKLDNTQKIAETISGIWGGELPEMAGARKSEVEDIKAFMRSQNDKVRMVYDRRVSEFPRQCIFWGTTNDLKPLRDPTGNRSFWPVMVATPMIDTNALTRNRDQLWAEAMVVYRAMRAATPRDEDLPFVLTPAALAEAVDRQETARTPELHEMWAETVIAWTDKPITLRELRIEMELTADETFRDLDDRTGEVRVLRVAFIRDHAAKYAVGKDRGITDYQTAQNIERALPLVKGWHQPDSRPRVCGKQARWWVRENVTAAELKQGYREILSTG